MIRGKDIALPRQPALYCSKKGEQTSGKPKFRVDTELLTRSSQSGIFDTMKGPSSALRSIGTSASPFPPILCESSHAATTSATH